MSKAFLAVLLVSTGCGEGELEPVEEQAPVPNEGPAANEPVRTLLPAEAADNHSFEPAIPQGEVLGPCAGVEGPVIPILLVDFWLVDQPERRRALADRLVSDFALATDCAVQIEIVDRVDVSAPTHDTTEILARYPDLDEWDAQRLWYYETNNVHQILVDLRAALESVDALPEPQTVVVALSEPQFEASAYFIPLGAEGLEPLVLIESHSLGGWSLGPDYTSAAHDAAYLADEIIHELGHFMGLRHACGSCFELGDYEAMQACCEACPYADDVMSYCRDRLTAGETETHRFGVCTMDWIESSFIPAYEAGGDGPVQLEACEG